MTTLGHLIIKSWSLFGEGNTFEYIYIYNSYTKDLSLKML